MGDISSHPTVDQSFTSSIRGQEIYEGKIWHETPGFLCFEHGMRWLRVGAYQYVIDNGTYLRLCLGLGSQDLFPSATTLTIFTTFPHLTTTTIFRDYDIDWTGIKRSSQYLRSKNEGGYIGGCDEQASHWAAGVFLDAFQKSTTSPRLVVFLYPCSILTALQISSNLPILLSGFHEYVHDLRAFREFSTAAGFARPIVRSVLHHGASPGICDNRTTILSSART